MSSPTLSYLMTTRNKLMFLRHTLPRLLANVQEDEEVIVIDGASTDGTTEYLRDLYAQGKIHQFLSEPDINEAHALNKGLLMARGELVKFITDDDVFHYPTIKLCKEYMLNNPDVDVLGSEGGFTYYGVTESIGITSMGQGFDIWAREGRPFMFSGLGLMLRRQSLPLIGLISTAVISTDEEIARRISSLPVHIAWCSGLTFVHFRTPASNGIRLKQLCDDEVRRLKIFYKCEDPLPPLWYRFTRPIRWALRPIKRMLIQPRSLIFPPVTEDLIKESIECIDVWFEKQNTSRPCSFRKAVRRSNSAKRAT